MVFKKQLSVLMTFFLLVSNLGLAFTVHYCDDAIASISLNTQPETQQKIDECCGIIEKDSKCCNDKIIKAELKSEQLLVKTLSVDTVYIAAFESWKPQFFVVNQNFKKRDNNIYYCDAHAPPLYLLYSQYTFYC